MTEDCRGAVAENTHEGSSCAMADAASSIAAERYSSYFSEGLEGIATPEW